MDGDKVILEDNGTDKIYYTYDSSDKLVSMNLNGIEYYYVSNGQGDIIGLVDTLGIQVVGYTYDSWGKLMSTTGTLKDTVGVKNPYLYRGYRYDTETGFYYLQSRYYNPETCRMLNSNEPAMLMMNQGNVLQYNLFAYLTILNRRRYIPEINDSNKIVKSFGEKLVMNTPIQGSAADIIKLAMVNVYKT